MRVPKTANVRPPAVSVAWWAHTYTQRNTVKQCINRLKQGRSLATQTDKLAIATRLHSTSLPSSSGHDDVHPNSLTGEAPLSQPSDAG
ncbi:hypothetical protein J2X68_008071 [Streptomyces sp. 3330]|nr:hypothetical protein [Streptomyces sp. 3330]